MSTTPGTDPSHRPRLSDLQDQFGPIDIYLFDQLLRQRIVPGMRVLDAGCGAGRNLVYLLRAGYDVFGSDADPASIEAVRRMAAQLAPHLPSENFRVEPVEHMSFPDRFADVVISSAVLHFASDDAQFDAMLRDTWRVLRADGLFFCRLASSIGMEQLVQLSSELGGELLDPLKTTIVQNQRCMTTWVVRKVG
jgi:tellurite methyltransferase